MAVVVPAEQMATYRDAWSVLRKDAEA